MSSNPDSVLLMAKYLSLPSQVGSKVVYVRNDHIFKLPLCLFIYATHAHRLLLVPYETAEIALNRIFINRY